MADEHGSGPLTPGDPLWSGGSTPKPTEPRREPEPGERTAPPLAPPAPDEPAAGPGFSGAGGYGTRPVPPGAFAPPAAASAREPWVLAEWWRRAAAAIIDGVIVTVVATILLIPFVILGLSVDTEGGAIAFSASLLLFLLIVVVASFLYAPVLMARTNGQTVGKMAVDIRVVRASGRTMEFGWAFLREVVVKTLVFGTLSTFTFGLASLLDWLWPLWDSENRALHDFMVDTRVVRA